MAISDEELDKLIEHEARYFGFVADVTRTESAWYLNGPALPDYWDANRALRLRNDGRGPALVTAEVVARLSAAGVRPVIDLDPIAERQGFVRALTDSHFKAAPGDSILMQATGNPSSEIATHVCVRQIDKNDRQELQTWVDIAVCDHDASELDIWRTVAEHESRSPDCLLYVAESGGRPVSVCDLYRADGWGRIDSVATLPEFRRRGAASAVVAYALADSIERGNAVTYLVTGLDSPAERVYRRLGFTTWGVNVLRRFLRR